MSPIFRSTMSRSKDVQRILGDPELRVKNIKPQGDCFYDAISDAFSSVDIDVRDSAKITAEPGDSESMALRRTAAMAVSDETFQTFKMFLEAGLPDFNFMKRCKRSEDLKNRLLVSGKETSAGMCIWANEFEMEVICSALNIVCLVIDFQARDSNNRFVSVGKNDNIISDGETPKFVILQRTRREHYNLVYAQTDTTTGLFKIEELTETIKELWHL